MNELRNTSQERRSLGRSGLRVPNFGFGAGTFGGRGPLFSAWGNTAGSDARRMVDVCLDAGVDLFDTADVYSDGESERVLGEALGDRRSRVLLSTKVGLRSGPGPLDVGASRHHLLEAVHASLRRLGTDYIDILQLHAFDANTPLEETLGTLGDLVRDGKVRYVGASNYAAWRLMKALVLSERHGWPRLVAHQAYYSLLGRDFEWDLLPLGLDQGVGTLVWSPLGWGRLTGKFGRDRPLPARSRLHETRDTAPPVPDERLYRVLDALEAVAAERGVSVPQVALNWLRRRPTVSSVLIGARNEAQLVDNLAALRWTMSDEEMERLDEASAVPPPYPHYPYYNGQFAELAPVPRMLGGTGSG